MKDRIQDRMDENLARVSSLVSIYEGLRGQGSGRRGASKTDVLRAAVVLLHAALEDFLRSLAGWRLPSVGTNATLDDIPFKGKGPRPQKVFLGYLADHRGKTVDELIGLSVDEFLERSNYNDTNEVTSLLSAIGVDVTKVNVHFALIAELMERRHQIVHRADRDESGGKGKHSVRSISPTKVRSWLQAVTHFTEDTFGLL